ncbi:MAG TPA: hypothetical protein VNG29_01950 [Candidatus Paceibacterota bacterium]|nr:hypothetical protein [Candidatus Paceibacterota bacterium]
MDERGTNILEAAIEAFIASGEPVSSSRLYNEYDFGIRPAMIRLELEKLSDEGFLEQPHHSAGRVPTDRGYEFFAERILEDEDGAKRAERFAGFRSMLARGALPDLAEELAEELGLLSVATAPSRRSLYKEGLDGLVEQMDGLASDDLKSIVRDFVEIDERLARIAKTLERSEATPAVFVGRKSPITKSETLSVVMGRYEADGGPILLFAIGPKRMDYRKAVRMFKNL